MSPPSLCSGSVHRPPITPTGFARLQKAATQCRWSSFWLGVTGTIYHTGLSPHVALDLAPAWIEGEWLTLPADPRKLRMGPRAFFLTPDARVALAQLLAAGCSFDPPTADGLGLVGSFRQLAGDAGLPGAAYLTLHDLREAFFARVHAVAPRLARLAEVGAPAQDARQRRELARTIERLAGRRARA